jgi:uncharacterized protein YegJ (DUF2314 family)
MISNKVFSFLTPHSSLFFPFAIFIKTCYARGMKREKIFIVLCIVFLFSCRKSYKLAMSGESARTMLQAYQTEKMTRIAEDAQDTMPGFFRHLNRKDSGSDYFCIKYPFAVNDDSGITGEQLWLTGIHFKNGIYYGIIANNPQHLNGMKKGDTVIFEMDNVTDWMYVRNGKITGGESIKYLLDQIPQNQLDSKEHKLLGMLY